MSMTFSTSALIEAAEKVLKQHRDAVEQWQRQTAAYQAEHRDTWWSENHDKIVALRNYLTRCLKNNTPPDQSEACRLMASRNGYISFYSSPGEPGGDKPAGYYVRNVGSLPGLVAMLKAHTGETISANELKLVGYDKLTDLFTLAAAAGGRVDK